MSRLTSCGGIFPPATLSEQGDSQRSLISGQDSVVDVATTSSSIDVEADLVKTFGFSAAIVCDSLLYCKQCVCKLQDSLG